MGSYNLMTYQRPQVRSPPLTGQMFAQIICEDNEHTKP